MKTIRKLLDIRLWGYGLFWSWNIIFLAFMVLGFAPTLLPEMIPAVRAGVIPLNFVVYGSILTLIPVLAVLLGLTRLRRAPRRLLALGYGVEGPLMMLLAVRFFLIRQANPAVTLLGVIAGLGLAALLWQLLDRRIEERGRLLTCLRVAGLTLLLFIGLYAAAWLAFYAPPIASYGWKTLDDLVRYPPEWRWVPLWLLGTLLAAYTAMLVVAMPLAVSALYVRAWWRGMRSMVGQAGRWPAGVLTAAVLVACGGLLVLTNRQPQQQAFALLEAPLTTPDQARALLEKEEAIRAGLLNSYLAPVRYVSAVGEVHHVSQMYKWLLGVPMKQARRIQAAYEVVARPLLYKPVHPPSGEGEREDNRALRDEPVEAAKLYETFFDRPIVEGEHEAIIRAARSTWSPDQAQAAWMAVDDREVHLVRQEVTVTEHGDWAEVELYEVYQNQTAQRQEVVYYFSLPESAAITGLWLGNSPDRDRRFPYRVAPRGAAQEVYRLQVQRRIDPALVEQIGPRQYRLRAFPVEPRNIRWDAGTQRSTVQEGAMLHLWLTCRVLAQGDTWPLPQLAERRNVYWDRETVRLVNGKPMAAEGDEWLPASVPATSAVTPALHRVDFPGGRTVLVRPAVSNDRPPLPAGLRLAVVLDRSRSMAGHAAEVRAALTRLASLDATVEVYLTASAYRGEGPSRLPLAELNADDILYFGGQNAAELLAQFEALRGHDPYEAVLILTDDSGYELSAEGVEVPAFPAAVGEVWMVHLGGRFPLGYDDATLAAIQASGGGVAGSLEEALARLAAGLAGADDVIDGYVWQTLPTAEAQGKVEADFGPLAARHLILAEMERQRGALDQLTTLDALHAIAVEQSIVTPYSSMIVLVNQGQEAQLEQLEGQDDRFQREHEEVGETLPPNTLDVAGVPEPEEWLLLALAAAMLLAWVRKEARGRRQEA